MRIVAVSTFADDLGPQWLAAELFHGSVEVRESVTDPESIYGYRREVGVLRVRQRFESVPTLFVPSVFVVADSDLADHLAGLNKVLVQRAEIASLVSLPLTNDSEEIRRLAGGRKLDFVADLFARLPNRIGDATTLPEVREVIPPVLERIDRFHDRIDPNTSSTMKASYARYRDWLPRYIRATVFETYPFCFSGGGYLMTPEVYNVVRPHIVKPYFAVFELDFE